MVLDISTGGARVFHGPIGMGASDFGRHLERDDKMSRQEDRPTVVFRGKQQGTIFT